MNIQFGIPSAFQCISDFFSVPWFRFHQVQDRLCKSIRQWIDVKKKSAKLNDDWSCFNGVVWSFFISTSTQHVIDYANGHCLNEQKFFRLNRISGNFQFLWKLGIFLSSQNMRGFKKLKRNFCLRFLAATNSLLNILGVLRT